MDKHECNKCKKKIVGVSCHLREMVLCIKCHDAWIKVKLELWKRWVDETQ